MLWQKYVQKSPLSSFHGKKSTLPATTVQFSLLGIQQKNHWVLKYLLSLIQRFYCNNRTHFLPKILPRDKNNFQKNKTRKLKVLRDKQRKFTNKNILSVVNYPNRKFFKRVNFLSFVPHFISCICEMQTGKWRKLKVRLSARKSCLIEQTDQSCMRAESISNFLEKQKWWVRKVVARVSNATLEVTWS